MIGIRKKDILLLDEIFSQAFLNRLLLADYTDEYVKAVETWNLPFQASAVFSNIEFLYSLMRLYRRNEYFVKNEFFMNNSSDDTVLTECPTGRARLDLLSISDNDSCLYEIKTELDSLDRLELQVLEYRKIADKVCIIAAEKHLKELLKRYKGSSIGIFVIHKNGEITPVQQPESDKSLLNKEDILLFLNQEECENIFKSIGIDLPQSKLLSEYLTLFSEIPVDITYPLFLRELKKRKCREVGLTELPEGIRFLAYREQLSTAQCDILKLHFSDRLEERIA